MNRRLLVALAASAVLIAGTVPAVAAKDPVRQFERLDVSKIDPKLGPSLLANRPVTVVVQMKGTPVTARNGLSKAQAASAASRLRTNQNRFGTAATKLGGKVLGKYQYAYNGVKVRIDGRKVAALAAQPNVVAIRRLEIHEEVVDVRNVGEGGADLLNVAERGLHFSFASLDDAVDHAGETFDEFRPSDLKGIHGHPRHPKRHHDRRTSAVVR